MCLINQYDALQICAEDSASWYDMRNFPGLDVCRLILLLADFAAENPLRWKATRLRMEAPELGMEELRIALATSRATLYRHLRPIIIGEYAGESPLHRSPHETGCTLTWRRTVRLCAWSVLNAERWRVIRCSNSLPGARQEEVAGICRVTQQRVSEYLRPFRLPDDDNWIYKRNTEEIF